MLALSPGGLLSYGRRFLFVLLLLVGFSLATSVGGDSGADFAPRAYANPLEEAEGPLHTPEEEVSPPEELNQPDGYTPGIFRARHGQVYQVLQHRNSNEISTGAEMTRVMMVVGSIASTGSCNAAGDQGPPPEQAETLAATGAGSAFPITSVYKSAIIQDATPPCFNYDGPNRDGLVCIGPECSTNPDPFLYCTCAPGDDCVSFTITNPSAPGVAPLTLTTDTPAATLVSPFTPPGPQCPFANRATYTFGTGGGAPTTNEDVCTAPPSDGFNLPGTPSIWPGGVNGTTIIIAYNVSSSFGFNLAEAVFHIDTDGVNPARCSPSTGSVVGAAAANRSIPPPLFAQLESFTATSLGHAIRVEWATSSEINNLGFNLYRSTTNVAPATPLNQSLIPSQAPGGGQGFSYEWLDEEVVAGETYHYWIEDVDVDGTHTLHEPIVVTHQPPTAVTLATLGMARPAAALPWLLALGTVGVGLALLSHRRRRAA